MKPESDFSYSEPVSENSNHSSDHSLNLPFALLCCAIAVVLISSTVTTFKQRSALLLVKDQKAEMKKQRDAIIGQSSEIENKLKNLLVDLLNLSKTDDEAAQIVSKNGIQQNGQPAATPAPAK